ncbi:MAG: alpha/beta fold hydrolase [Acetobacteraceae bacterium]
MQPESEEDYMQDVTRRQVVASLTAALLYASRSGAVEPGLAPAPTAGRTSIDESGFVPIGGIEQWIAIRGQHAHNPVIIFLHGGPGDAQSPFLAEFAPWEKDFAVVTWDQRGSGKTYGRYGQETPGMATPAAAFERLIQDAIELTEYVRRRLRKERAVLIGHSVGSVLGLKVMHRRPDLFHAYVATGFPASWPLVVHARETWIRGKARRAGDQRTLKALGAAARLPIGDLQRFIVGQDYLMGPSDIEYLNIEGKFIGRPPAPTKGDVADWLGGFNFSQARVFPAVTSFVAREFTLDIAVPFFVIQGRDDHVVSDAAAKAYVAAVRAPHKAFVAIDGGHFACFMNPTEFVSTLRKLVLGKPGLA